MLIFVDVRVDPKGMSQEELWEAWEEEAAAALAAKEAGTVVSLYKVSGQRRVLAVLDVGGTEGLDGSGWAPRPLAPTLGWKGASP